MKKQNTYFSATRRSVEASEARAQKFLDKCARNGIRAVQARRLEELASTLTEWAVDWSVEKVIFAGLSEAVQKAAQNSLTAKNSRITCIKVQNVGPSLTAYRESSLGVFRAFAGVAETGGLVVLDDWESNLASLIPEYSVGLVEAGEVVQDYWELARILKQMEVGGMVIVSGPSSTSDIELTHVTGVHGPVGCGVIVAGFELNE